MYTRSMRFLPHLALLGQTLIAAGTFLIAKDATGRFTSNELVWFRITLSALLVWPAHLVFLGRPPAIPRRDLLRIAILGILGTTLNQGLFLTGLARTTPLHAALLYAFTPTLVLLGSVIFLHERLTWARITGVVIALGGVLLVLTAQGLSLGAGTLAGDLLVLGAVTAWATYTVLGKDVLRRYHSFSVVTVAFTAGALSMLPFAPWVLDGFDWSGPGTRGWLDLLYLGAVTSGVAFSLWYYALQRLEASQTAVYNNLQAPTTALFAFWFLGTVPVLQVVIGGVLVLAGVTLAQRRPPIRAAGRTR